VAVAAAAAAAAAAYPPGGKLRVELLHAARELHDREDPRLLPGRPRRRHLIHWENKEITSNHQ
jgi:hypothetical protein